MRDLGYVEGRNFVMKYRDAEEKPERVAALATEIGCAQGRRDRGYVTGLSIVGSELVGKCLELLTQSVPGVSRVAVLWQLDASPEHRERGGPQKSRHGRWGCGRNSLGCAVPPISNGRSRT